MSLHVYCGQLKIYQNLTLLYSFVKLFVWLNSNLLHFECFILNAIGESSQNIEMLNSFNKLLVVTCAIVASYTCTTNAPVASLFLISLSVGSCIFLQRSVKVWLVIIQAQARLEVFRTSGHKQIVNRSTALQLQLQRLGCHQAYFVQLSAQTSV